MRRKWERFITLNVLMLLLFGCHLPFTADQQEKVNPSQLPPTSIGNSHQPETSDEFVDLGALLNHPIIPPGAISPKGLVYKGAFRLPDDSGGMGWDYSGHGMTFYPDGDAGSVEDGYPGSLFIVGHDQQLFIGEVSIPVPVNSRNLKDLNTAETLQQLADISGGALRADLALPRMGIEYLPPMNGMDAGKLHFAIGQHIQGFEASHGWASTNLTTPNSAGLWHFGNYTNYTTNDYLFEVPEDWAAKSAPGYRLASGRFREGVWGGLGPALYAYAPWLDGNPPAEGQKLQHIMPLILYGQQVEQLPELAVTGVRRMRVYAEADHWWGGAWLTASQGSSVIFTGTKALGRSWYGFANGVIWDYACTEDPDILCPDIPEYPYDNRGFWAEGYMPAVLFYDSQDLAKVAQGEMAPDEPQPYALMDLTAYWFAPEINIENYKRDLVGAAAFDRTNGLLYIVERLGDDYKSLIHVFQVESENDER